MVDKENLNNRLVLFEYMLEQLNCDTWTTLQKTLRNMDETYDSEGFSYFFQALKGLDPRISEEELKRYDQNIKSYMESINNRRTEMIHLKYFQYVAVLFTEIFLDNRFRKTDEFIEKLNKFAKGKNQQGTSCPNFTKDDLSKLAFWMATGSGKTLIMHINWLQFKRYNDESVDNVLLITPNENLSSQHLDELENSGIPARIFNDSEQENDSIGIIEIHKLTKEKKGEG